MGLKSFCSNTALLTVAKSLKGKEHKDIALAFGDADILAYSNEQHLEQQSEHISKGGLVMEGSYRNDLDKLFEEHINIGVANVCWEAMGKIQKQLRLQGNGLKALLDFPPSFNMIGGNSSCSMILAALSGGIPSHAKYFDDMALANTMKDLLAQSHHMKDMRTFLAANAGNDPQFATKHFVLTDGGAQIRAARKNLPIPEAFMSHNPKLKGKLTPLTGKQLNKKRLLEDISAIFQPLIGNMGLSNVQEKSTLWNDAANIKLSKHISRFLKEVEAKRAKIPTGIKFDLAIDIIHPSNNNQLPKIRVTVNGNSYLGEYSKPQIWLEKELAKKLAKQTPPLS